MYFIPRYPNLQGNDNKLWVQDATTTSDDLEADEAMFQKLNQSLSIISPPHPTHMSLKDWFRARGGTGISITEYFPMQCVWA